MIETAEQNTADDEAAITQSDDDATAEGDWQGNAAFGVAGAIQQLLIAVSRHLKPATTKHFKTSHFEHP